MPDETRELPAVEDGASITEVIVASIAAVPACDLTPYTTPGLPPPPGCNDLGVSWGYLDPGVLRAFRYLSHLPHRSSEEIVRRAAVLLAADPHPQGTPVRCYECHKVYYVLPDEPDWNVAGREDGLCFTCTLTLPAPVPVLEGTVVAPKHAIEGGEPSTS